MAVVVLDAGHGGSDLGATYQGRQEKDDTLALTLAVGRLLAEDPDIDVVYTRETDVYDTPLVKARKANAANADYFISIHRNSTPVPSTYSGVETLVYSKGTRAEMLGPQYCLCTFRDRLCGSRYNGTEKSHSFKAYQYARSHCGSGVYRYTKG